MYVLNPFFVCLFVLVAFDPILGVSCANNEFTIRPSEEVGVKIKIMFGHEFFFFYIYYRVIAQIL